MREFAHRPLGYLAVGGLAMVLCLSSGVGIGYFFGGKDAPETAVVVEEPTIAKVIIKPIPAPPPLATEVPAPWPELARRIADERREQARKNALARVAAAEEKLLLAGTEDLWPTSMTPPEEPSSYKETPDLPEQTASLPPVTEHLEQPGARIDHKAEAWEAHSVTVADPAGKPMISIVIDDLGLNHRNTVRTIRLPGPLTLAFLTYAEDLEHQISSAHTAGHELMVHFPMARRLRP